MNASGLHKGSNPLCPDVIWNPSTPSMARCVFFALLSIAFSAVAGFGQEKKTEKQLQWEDYAEVYTDRYIEPHEVLKLGETAQKRARILALYAMGLTFEEQRKADQAIEAYRKVLELVPSYAELARKVGFLLGQNGRPVEGRKVLEESLAKNPSSPHSYLVLSEFLGTFLSNSPDNQQRAVELAEEAVKKFPGHPDVYDHIVKTYLIGRQPEKAQAVMDEALKREDPNPFYWLRLAETAKRVWPVSTKEGSEPVRINGIYEKALERAPKHPLVQEKVADHYRDSRQSEKARDLYLNLIERFPDRLDLRKNLASVYGALGKNDERIEALKAVIQINPQDAETHKELGRIYQARDDKENAIEHFRQSLRIAQGTVNEYYELGVLLLEAGQGEEAATLLERGAYLFPSQPIMPVMLTHAFSMMDDWEKAVKQFEKAVELASQSRPDMLNDRFYFRYGAAVERAGDLDRAANLFRKSMDLLSNDSTGRDDEQDREFRAQLYNYLGYMWIENDMKIEEAGALIEQAYELDPASGAITDSIGWLRFKQGRYEDAQRELLKAVGMIEKPDAVIHDHLAQVHFQLGDTKEALAQIKKAVELDPENEDLRKRLKEYEKAAPKEPDAKPDEKKPAEPESSDAPKEKPESESKPEEKKDAA